jgi:hypothetical protein
MKNKERETKNEKRETRNEKRETVFLSLRDRQNVFPDRGSIDACGQFEGGIQTDFGMPGLYVAIHEVFQGDTRDAHAVDRDRIDMHLPLSVLSGGMTVSLNQMHSVKQRHQRIPPGLPGGDGVEIDLRPCLHLAGRARQANIAHSGGNFTFPDDRYALISCSLNTVGCWFGCGFFAFSCR